MTANLVTTTAPSLPRPRRREPRLRRRRAQRLRRPRLQRRRLRAASSAVLHRRRPLRRRVPEYSGSRPARPRGSSHSLPSGSAPGCTGNNCPSRSRRPTAGGSADRRLGRSASPRTPDGLRGNGTTGARQGSGPLQGDEPSRAGRNRCNSRSPRYTHPSFPEDQPDPPWGRDRDDDPAGNISLSSQRDARRVADRHVGPLPRKETPTAGADGLPSAAQLPLPLRRHGDAHPLTRAHKRHEFAVPRATPVACRPGDYRDRDRSCGWAWDRHRHEPCA